MKYTSTAPLKSRNVRLHIFPCLNLLCLICSCTPTCSFFPQQYFFSSLLPALLNFHRSGTSHVGYTPRVLVYIFHNFFEKGFSLFITVLSQNGSQLVCCSSLGFSATAANRTDYLKSMTYSWSGTKCSTRLYFLIFPDFWPFFTKWTPIRNKFMSENIRFLCTSLAYFTIVAKPTD